MFGISLCPYLDFSFLNLLFQISSPTFNLYLSSPPCLNFFVEARGRYVLVQVRTELDDALCTQANETDIITFLKPYLEPPHKASDNNQTPH